MRFAIRAACLAALCSILGITLQVFAAASPPANSVAEPLEPRDALRAFQLDPELRIELVASEPQIVDPVAIQFGADGKLWVVEMRDYPYGPKPGESPRSRIVVLTDKDRDGHYETSTVFADQLLFVTGLLPYREGVIVTMAGRIAFFADRDGDGAAEFRETWFSGFAQENSQLRANHPTFGLDGWVYVANGLRGGKVVAERPSWKKTSEPLTITGFDFRFHPETGEFGLATGHGQFGLCTDDFGRRYVCSNRNPCQHVVFEDADLRANPGFAAKRVMQDVCAPAESSRLYPISKAWTTSTLHANQFTAACGVTIYRGDLLPAGFRGNAFTCDPTGNLVHREVVTAAGASFAGSSPDDNREFLATADLWFRPVNLAHGPDGALYVVDMYRAVIEHPDFMPEELKTRKDLLLGTDRGRIYRVVPKSDVRKAASDLTALSNEELVGLLDHSNSFQRDTAARLLRERDAREVAPRLIEIVIDGGQHAPAGVTVALALLHEWSRLTPAATLAAIRHPSPEVRECAIRCGTEQGMLLRADLSALTSDPNSRVRFQLAVSLARLPVDQQLVGDLMKLADSDLSDPWMQSALQLAARERASDLVESLLRANAERTGTWSGLVEFVEPLAEQLAGRDDLARVRAMLATVVISAESGTNRSPLVTWAVLRGVGRGLQRRGIRLVDSVDDPAVKAAMGRILASVVTTATSEDVDGPTRVAALQTCRFGDGDTVKPILVSLATSEGTSELALAALDVLSALPQADVAEPLLARFPTAAPATRRAILDALLANEGRVAALLAAVERGAIAPAEIDPARVQRLVNHRNGELREKAKQLLAVSNAERSAIVAKYSGALTMSAQPERGRVLFEKQCATCHRVAEIGVNVGPDIADSRTKTPEMLLIAILDPNRAVDNNSFAYAVTTVQGRALTGLITAETSTSITLKQPEGKTETILRAEIEEMRSTGQSLMPVGFEKNMTVEQVADLIAFLKNWRYLDGSVPLDSAPMGGGR